MDSALQFQDWLYLKVGESGQIILCWYSGLLAVKWYGDTCCPPYLTVPVKMQRVMTVSYEALHTRGTAGFQHHRGEGAGTRRHRGPACGSRRPGPDWPISEDRTPDRNRWAREPAGAKHAGQTERSGQAGSADSSGD